jgi:hypothetical protein
MATVKVAETLRAAFSLYREALPLLVRRALPVIAVADTIDLLPESDNPLIFLLLMLASSLALAWASACSLRTMLWLRTLGTVSSLNTVSFILFALVLGYVTLAASVGFLLLVVPALIFTSAAVLAPVFALEHHQGPFEAVASSTDRAKGNLLPITGVLLLTWLALAFAGAFLTIAASFTGAAAVALNYVASVAVGFAGLFDYAIVVVLLERLSPDPFIQESAGSMLRLADSKAEE